MLPSFLRSASAHSVDGEWFELESNEEESVYALLNDVYTIHGKDSDDEQMINLQRNLEYARGLVARDEILSELIKLQDKSPATTN